MDFPNLETLKLVLNQFDSSDAEKIATYLNDVDMSKFVSNIPFPYSLENASTFIDSCREQFLIKKSITFAIREKSSQILVGSIAIQIKARHKRGVLGFWIAKDYWRRGFATESLEKVLEFAFDDLKLNKLEAVHHTENLASGKLMRKVGMVKEGELKQHYFKNDKFWDVVTMGICRDDYIKNQA
ncbi:GNAT family N-acetyltransferase [bacterium]|jgi:[ribosomal protein S5]-alanine N-acetyltransferase|nr:GNAT family N-acetyltransferase [bacterium]MBT6293643.1 GNAT family N-acetyltransferase [bacterium]